MSEFRCPITGNFLTQCLVWEFKHDNERSLYTVKDEDYTMEDGRVLPSLKRLYLEMEDPTEYLFATTYFYSWDHWQRCVSTNLYLEHVKKWRAELEIKIISKGVRQVLCHATGERGYQAAKWLAEKGWIDKKVGRPTTEDVENELKQMARIKETFQDDLSRVSEYMQ